MFKYFIISLLAYFVYHNILAPMFQNIQSPQQPKPNNRTQTGYQEDDSVRHFKQKNQRNTKPNDSDFADYEEIK